MMVIYGHILSQRVALVKEIKNKCKKCSKSYILWLQSCNTTIFTTAINMIKGAHKETQVPFKHMLN